MRAFVLPLLVGASCLSSLQGRAAVPEAAWFVGEWACAARDGSGRFTWRVEKRLAGRWLTGEGVEGGQVASLDVWAYDDAGRLGVRRQFSPRNFYLELEVAGVGDMALDLEGRVRRGRAGDAPVRESIRFTSRDSFDAVWQVHQDGAWATVVDEVCRRS